MNLDNLKTLIKCYEDNLELIYNTEHDELFKWRAVQHFRDVWYAPENEGLNFAQRFNKAKKEYESIPTTDRITKRDIEQGTVTISNIGSLYRGQKGNVGLLEIIPPQVSAFGVGAVQDRPVVVTDEKGNKAIEIRQVLPICIAFDHRALDFGEAVPFIKRLDDIFANPEQIHSWKGKEKNNKYHEFVVTAV